ncbi:MAG: DUF4302 domain-containing protein [Bacteroidota bacterium]
MEVRNILLCGICAFLFLLSACEDEDNDLPSVEDRIESAINELRDELTQPANGWRLDYQPSPNTGLFYILLDFDDNGQVTIKSDVPDNAGEFFEQTVSYRIDNGLSLELILETYGVFHFLFEKDQSSFGGEFEFLFDDKQGSDLLFRSKSDVGSSTRLVFSPAEPNAESLLSGELATNISKYNDFTTLVVGGYPPTQQLILENANVSIFWTIDVESRIIEFDAAGVGSTVQEFLENTVVPLSHSTGYIFLDGSLVLVDPLTVNVNGEQFLIEEIRLDNFSMDGEAFCESNIMPTAVYEGSIQGVGPVKLLRSFFDLGGLDFTPMDESGYGVNIIFVIDSDDRSLADQGSISEAFPDAVGFLFNYGLVSDSIPSNSLGVSLEDDDGNRKIYLREFEVASVLGNRLEINLLNSFYYSDTPTVADEQGLAAVTEEIFAEGTVYISDVPNSGEGVFRLFNACNMYQLFLVR